jgi:hypothetical protein
VLYWEGTEGKKCSKGCTYVLLNIRNVQEKNHINLIVIIIINNMCCETVVETGKLKLSLCLTN